MLAASDPHWTDYIAALGTLVSIPIAAAALWMAKKSADDANESAEAAKATAEAAKATEESAREQLAIAKGERDYQQRQRAQRPVVARIELVDVESQTGEALPDGIFAIRFVNAGDLELRDATLSILLSTGRDALVTDRWGSTPHDCERDVTRERWPAVDGGPRTFDHLTIRCSVPVGERLTRYVCLQRIGRFPLRVKLFSASLERRGPWADAWVEIDEQKRATIEIPTAPDTTPYAGRCADFDAA